MSTSLPSTSDSNVLIFKCICNFIKDLNESFGKYQKSLLLYAHLIEKTGIIHEEPIKKHMMCFHDFVKANEEAILAKDWALMNAFTIHYSDKVFIDIRDVYQRADAEEKKILWMHLITLLAVLHPSSQAKKVLQEEKSRKEKVGEEANEEQFLSKLIDKVSVHMNPKTSTPTEMMSNLMTSGVFNELVDNMNQGFSNGDLDIGKMIGSLQSMIGNLNTMVGSLPQQSSPESTT